MLHSNALVIIIALDHIEYDVGSRIGCGGERFIKNRSVNVTAVVLARDHSVFQRAARGGACANERLRIAIVDQILNSGGLCQNGSCFSNGKTANLKFGHSLVVITLGYVYINVICSRICGRTDKLIAVRIVIPHGDSTHTDDAAFRFDKRCLCGAVVDCAVGKSSAEIVCLRRCLLNGIGRIRTARVVAFAHNRDGVTAGTDRHTVHDSTVILTVIKRNTANGDDHGGNLCHAVVFGIRYGDNSILRKIRALLDGDVGQLGFVCGGDDLAVRVIEVVIFRNGVCPSNV